MTAFNAWLTNEKYIIATDTLCGQSTRFGIIHRNFITKIYHLPQYKCCFTSQGLRDLGLELFVHIQKDVKASTYSSLIESIKAFKISDMYKNVSPTEIGTIFLFGLNDVTDRLGMSKIYFDHEGSVLVEEVFNNITGHNMLYKPIHDSIDFKLLEQNLDFEEPKNIYDYLIKVTKEQKKAFDKEANPFIGGQIEITTMEYSNNFYSTFTEIAYDFEDYERVSKIIMNIR